MEIVRLNKKNIILSILEAALCYRRYWSLNTSLYLSSKNERYGIWPHLANWITHRKTGFIACSFNLFH